MCKHTHVHTYTYINIYTQVSSAAQETAAHVDCFPFAEKWLFPQSTGIERGKLAPHGSSKPPPPTGGLKTNPPPFVFLSLALATEQATEKRGARTCCRRRTSPKIGVTGGLGNSCSQGWSLPSGAPAVLIIPRGDVHGGEGSSTCRAERI